MNKIKATITSIESEDGISLICAEANMMTYHAVVLNSPGTDSYIRAGHEIYLVFKETEMAICKSALSEQESQISIHNRFSSIISSIEEGKILSIIHLSYYGSLLQSVITTASVRRLSLQVGDIVEGLVKTTEMSIMQIQH